MKKISEGIIVFISSVLALIISSCISKYLDKLYVFFDVDNDMKGKINGFLLALLVTILTALFQQIKDATWSKRKKFLSSVKIDIHFIDNDDRKISKVNFEIKEGCFEKQEIGIRVNIKKAGILPLYIAKKMGLVITLKYNPNYFSTELRDGFLAGQSSEILKLGIDGEIIVDILPNLEASLEPVRIDEHLIIEPKFLKPVKGKMLLNVHSKTKIGWLFNKVIVIQSSNIDLIIKEVKKDN